ncbi:MAG: TolC family outer membrane protein [Pseudomonadota bacterium]
MRVKLLLAAGILLSALQQSAAETLQDALTAAEATNPQLDVQRKQLEISEEQLTSAKGARLPTVEFTGSYGPETVQTNRAIVLDQGGRQIATTQLQAVQPLYAGGRINAGIREARAGIGSSNAQLDVTTQNTLLDTITVYMDVLRDREAVKIQESSVNLLSEQFQAAQDRFDVGEITRTDVALAEARLQGARADLSFAEAQSVASEATYRIIVGSEPDDLQPPPPIAQLPQSFEEALEIALDQSPDILAAEFSERAAEQRITTARSRLRPELNLVATAAFRGTLNQPDAPNFFGGDPNELISTPDFLDRNVSAFAQARIPLYQGGVARSQVRSAKLEKAQAELNVENQRRQTIAQVSQFWYAYQAAVVGIQASERQIQAAEIAFEGGQEELAVGVRTTLDVLDQEQDLLEARLSLVQAERDAYVAAHQLLRAMGTLTSERVYVNQPVDVN